MDLIIPTMWKIPGFLEVLEKYSESKVVERIILIDNNPLVCPEFSIPKVERVTYGRNIFVNPAWNEGWKKATSNLIGILNDDIEVSLELLYKISIQDFSEIDLLGFDLTYTGEFFDLNPLAIDKSQPLGSQCNGFGICMFLPRKNYKEIPSLYKVWFGDDYLCHHNERVYKFASTEVKGQISGTINSESSNIELQNRIQLDTENAHRYLIEKVS